VGGLFEVWSSDRGPKVALAFWNGIHRDQFASPKHGAELIVAVAVSQLIDDQIGQVDNAAASDAHSGLSRLACSPHRRKIQYQ
jgi:hypothetical protein